MVRGDSQQQQHQHLYGENAPIHTAGYYILVMYMSVLYAVALTSSLGVMSYVEESKWLGSFECYFVTKLFWRYLLTTSPLQLHQTRWDGQFWFEQINICFGNL